MSTTIDRASQFMHPRVSTKRPRTILQKVLLGCDIAYGVLYVIAKDVIAATLYDGSGRFVAYGVGASLNDTRVPDGSRARVPVHAISPESASDAVDA
jgi:hypothetical protein